MEIRKAAVMHGGKAALCGAGAVHSVKRYGEARAFYKSGDDGLKEDTVMYEVYQYTEEDDSHPGHLSWGLTVLYPLTVGGECNMTRGHFHRDRECAEVYCGAEGEGLLLLMDEEGRTWAEEVRPGSVHYIKGRLAHRLVNTGAGPLKVAACWPTAAGHDYESVERQPFGWRVYRGDSGLVYKKEGEDSE